MTYTRYNFLPNTIFMKTVYFFSLAILFFLSGTAVLGKAIPYINGFHGRPGLITDYPMGPPDADACGTVHFIRDYDILMDGPGIGSSSIGQTISSSSSFGLSYIYTGHQTQAHKRATISGTGCYPGVAIPEGQLMYYYAPIQYFGIQVVMNNLRYYGWVKVENGMISGYLEDIPGFSIKVGDTVGFLTYPSSFIKVSGTVYRDNNIDGVNNTGDTPMPFERVSMGIYSTLTASDGTYSMMVPGSLLNGSVGLYLQKPSRYVYNTPSNGTRSITFPQNSDIANLDFGVNYDLTTSSTEKIQVEVFEQQLHRRCFRSVTKIYVTNQSNEAMTDVPVKVEIPSYVEIINSVPAYQSLQSKIANYIIPTLGANSAVVITLTDSIICDNESIRGQSQCYRASIDIPFNSSDIFPYYECQDTKHLFKLVNKGNAEMTDSLDYKVFLNNVFQGVYKYKTSGADTFYIELPNDGRSMRLEVFQDPLNVRTTMRQLVAEGCGSFPVSLSNIGWADQASASGNFSAYYCFTIRDSYDPNELIASPTGWGTAHKILKDQLITYKIGFQNTGSADAVSIVLVDTLSSALDLSTLKILNSTHAIKKVEISPVADGRIKLSVTYAGINLPPSSVNEPGSHGYVEFSILPKSTTAIGTQIKNRAFIYFDFNSYIETNSVLQTIALPEVVSNPVAVRTSGGEFDVADQALVYGDAPIAPALTTNAGTDGLHATSLSPDVVTFESGKLVIHKSGTATIKYNHNGNARYLPITGVAERSVTVAKAPLTIQAVSVQRFVGETNPSFEWTATGFVYNEDESVLQGNPELSCSADAASVIAEYPITVSAGTMSAENYDITYTPGILKVVQTTGVQDWSASGIRVYPVPSKGGNFKVDVPYEKLDHVTLTDMLGKSEVHQQGQINSQLEGLVVIRIYTDKGIYSGKVELTK